MPQDKCAADRRRMRSSFALACALYVPLLALVAWRTPSLAFTPAGQTATVSISFAQMSGATAAAAFETPEGAEPFKEPLERPRPPQPEPEVEAVPEPDPKPDPESDPTPEPEPEPVMQEKPKPAPEPKPEPKREPVRKETPRARPQAPKPPAHEQAAQQAAQQPAPSASAPTDVTASQQRVGAPTAGAANGMATLVFGETDDPFLAQVKRRVEAHVKYPRKARMMRMQGKAIVQFVVEKDGTLRELELYRSSGHELLDKMAVHAIRKAQPEWGTPQSIVRLRFPIAFELTS